MFQNTLPQGLASPLGGMSANALWIFSPRVFSQQAKRPLLYQFKPWFVDAADEAVSRMSEQHNASQIHKLTTTPEYLTSIFASARPDYMVDMRGISTNYTFMLVTINDKVGPGGSMQALSDTQHLYYGYFIGEPFNPNHHFGRTTYNPDSVMIITHKTTINKASTYGGRGPQTQLHNMSDLDVIHPRLFCPIVQESTSLLRPEDLYASTTDGPNPVVMHPEAALLERQGDPISVASKLSIPRDNLRQVLNAVAMTKGAINAEIASGGFATTALGQDSYRTGIEQHLQDNAGRLPGTGMSVNGAVTLGGIVHRYNPTISPVQVDRAPRYNPADQTTTSSKNAFSSMLTTIIPAVMSEFLLLEIGFYYESHTDALQLYDSAATLSPMGTADMQQKINGFLHRLKSDIFPILRLSHGEFVLSLQCSCGGISHINLNFLDDMTINKDVFEVPTILGGLNSPMIGTIASFDHNAVEISKLIGCLADRDTDQKQDRLGHYDQQRFNTSLIGFDQTMTGTPGSSFGTPLPQMPNPSNRWNL